MIKEYDYYTNGIATILQSPERAQRLIRATNVGTLVEQDENTDAWFHIPLNTLTGVSSTIKNNTSVSSVTIDFLNYTAKVNENAKLDQIHLRDGTRLIANWDVNHIGRYIHENLSLSKQERGKGVHYGLAMSFFVRFLTGKPRGRVEFQSAGVRFSVKEP